MTLSPGTTLGTFEISGMIGAGGMGEVYRARDTKLGREVAIKVLPEEFAKDADRLARFDREAKLLAALNHPNVAGIHDLQEADGQKFLVMELAEGTTLAERISLEPIPVEEALPLFAQIAEALESAHEHGIIHRDLKPANIKISEDRKVKILDFGLAKAFGKVSETETGSEAATLVESDLTGERVIVGTPAYMSPEQASGQPVDKRADIWAFGCCLYQTLTGKRPFQGSNATELLADIIKGEPDWNALPKQTPGRVRILLWRCLQKDPRRRLRDIGEAVFEIAETSTDPSGTLPAMGPTGAEPGAGRTRHLAAMAATFVLGSLVTGLAIWNLKSSPPPAEIPSEPKPVRRNTISLGPGESWLRSRQAIYPWVALSPDGKNLAYRAWKNGQAHIFLRPLDRLEADVVSGGETALGVQFSPDGEWLIFNDTAGGISKLPVAGGRPVALGLEITSSLLAGGLSWGAEDEIFYGSGPGVGLSRIRASGGKPEVVVELIEGELGHLFPEALPGGKAVLFCSGRMLGSQMSIRIEAYSMESGERRTLIENAWQPRYVPTGHLLYVNAPGGDIVMAVPFDASELRITGPAVAIVYDALADANPQFTFSNDGTLVYVPRTSTSSRLRRLVWVDREGIEEPLDHPPREFGPLRISPDGRRVATSLTDAGVTNVHVLDLLRGTLSRITFGPGASQIPIWSPDGQDLYFKSFQESGVGIHRKRADGTGTVEPVLIDAANPFRSPIEVASDGSFMLTSEVRPGTGGDVYVANLTGDGEIRPLLNGRFNESRPTLSPDGRWIAYESDESGRSEVYVQPFPDLDGKWQISVEGGGRPIWGPDGKELLFQSAGSLMRAPIIETEPTFAPGAPEVLIEGPFPRGYTMAPDGRRFLVLKALEEEEGEDAPRPGNTMVVVYNWFEELKRLAPTKEADGGAAN